MIEKINLTSSDFVWKEDLAKKVNEIIDHLNALEEPNNEKKAVKYYFEIKLADNNIDRYFERFELNALEELRDMFIDKRVILPNGNYAIIYDTEIVYDESNKTIDGKDYYWLKGYASTDFNNKDVVENSNKKVSIGCSFEMSICSICDNDILSPTCYLCNHTKGKIYNGKLCYRTLVKPTDIHEVSFVKEPDNA